MDWLSLGHATWLCEAAGLRLLFVPLLGARHHGDVFEVMPRRTLVADALRPDFILVSHRHPDHFDVPSLPRLLALDRDAVVVTPDPLVAWAAERLGARTVRAVPAGQRIDLDGVTVITTPSLAPDEWGAVVATRDGAAWNQVDTVLVDAHEVLRISLISSYVVRLLRVTLSGALSATKGLYDWHRDASLLRSAQHDTFILISNHCVEIL